VNKHLPIQFEKINLVGITGQADNIMITIDEMEKNGISINSNIVSCLIRAYCNNGNITGAINAYYQTFHLASPKKSVFRSLLDKCVANKDKINADLGTTCVVQNLCRKNVP